MIKRGDSETEARRKSCYNSADLLRNYSPETLNKFTFWDCSGIKTLNTDKIEISYIKKHERSYFGGYYFVRAHFRIKGEKKELSYSKTDDKHTTAQHILASLIFNKEPIRMDYRDIPFYINDIDLKLEEKTTEHVLEQKRIDEEFGINRRADLLFELETPNLTFGKGFVFEITNTESWSNIKEKAKDWSQVGYTLIHIPIENFDFKNHALKKDYYTIVYRLFDDLNLYIEILQGIRESKPMIDNFNKQKREMERKLFLMRNYEHFYQLKHDEKVKSITLFCMEQKIDRPKKKRFVLLRCYDYMNRFIDVIVWESNPLFEKIESNEFTKKLVQINQAYFKEERGPIKLVLNRYSEISKVNINEVENASED